MDRVEGGRRRWIAAPPAPTAAGGSVGPPPAAGDYGVCEICGDPIAARRLRAIPEAATRVARAATR